MSPVRRRGGFRHRDSGSVSREALPSLQKGDRRGDMLLAVLHNRPLHGDAGQLNAHQLKLAVDKRLAD